MWLGLCPRRCRMEVTNRHGKGVGRVERPGSRLQPEQQRDHLLHLVLLSSPVADDRALHLGRRVFDNVAAGFNRGEHRDAARVSQLQRTAGVLRVKQVLDGDAVRTTGRELNGQFPVNVSEAAREGVAQRNDRAAGDEAMASSVGLHATVAGALGAGVDAKDSHASASISFSSMSKLAHTCCTSSWSSTASYSFSICFASLPVSLT